MKKNILIIADASTPNIGARGVQGYKIINSLIECYHVWLITSNKAKVGAYYEKLKVENKIRYYKNDNDYFLNKIIKKIYTPIHLTNHNYIKKSTDEALKIIEKEGIQTVVCFSIGYSNAIIGIELSKLTSGIKIIQFLSDPITDNVYNNRYFWENRFYSKLERKLIQTAYKIVVPSHIMRAKMSEIGANQVVLIPHVYDKEVLKKQDSNNNSFVISYFGNLNNYRNPLALLAFAEDNEAFLFENRIRFEFYGTISKSLKKKVKNTSVISFRDRVPYNQVGKLMERADAFLIIDAPISDSPFFPSKLVEYLPYNKPIIGITPKTSETAFLLNQMGFLAITELEIKSEFITMLKNIVKDKRDYTDAISPYYIKNAIGAWKKLINDNLN